MRTVLGLERLGDFPALFQGKAIGLITNFSGISPDWKYSDAEVFEEKGYRVVRLFTPEHGLYGAGAGEKVEDGQEAGGIPVVSLYGDKKKPAQEDLRGLEVLVFDIQDAGLRYYTYLYTMIYALEAAIEAKLPFVVLDRPNPLGGRKITGPRILPSFHSFVGDYELPMRHSLTLGEIARYYLKWSGKKAELTVIGMEQYTRDTLYPQTGLLWNIPSPSIPSFESAVCYSGGCLFEAVNVSEGRGSARPFQMYGAPYIDMDALYRDMARETDGAFVFRRRAFVPAAGKYAGEVCFGLEFQPAGEDADFLPTALTMMKAIHDRHPEQWEWRKEEGREDEIHLSILYGNRMAEEYLEGKISLARLKEAWEAEGEAFEEFVQEIRLYR